MPKRNQYTVQYRHSPFYKMRGFSLLEVLVAFSILAMTLGVLSNIYSRATMSIVSGNEYAKATLVAQSLLAGAGVSDDLEVIETSGTSLEKYNWVKRVTPYANAENEDIKIELRRVEVEINWESLGKTRRIKLQSLKPVMKT